MNKKITLGLFALLFVTSGVQSLAISKIQATQNSKNSKVAWNAFTSQQAAVGGIYNNPITDSADPSDSGPQGYVRYIDNGGMARCAYMIGNYFYTGGIITDAVNVPTDDISSPAGCTGARRQASNANPVDLTIEFPSIDSQERTVLVSGSSTPVMQFKLFVLGYLAIDNITGNLEEVTKKAVMNFQKNRGLSQTGILDVKTETSLNSIFSAVKSNSVALAGPVTFVSKNTNQKAAVGSYNNITTSPDSPHPQGYISFIAPDGTRRCAFIQNHTLYVGTPTGPSSNTDTAGYTHNNALYSNTNCGGARAVMQGIPVDLTIEFPTIDSKDKIVVISGSSVPVMQFKLGLLGYMNIDQITGNLDEVTKSAILEFQANQGLPQVGTFGPKTETALNSVISGFNNFSVLTGGSFIFK